MSDGSKFDKTKTYKVALNSYQANGGGNFVPEGLGWSKQEFEKHVIAWSDQDVRHYIADYLHNHDTIVPKLRGDWSIVPDKWFKKGVPIQWNALKLLNSDGEFFDKATGEQVLKIAEAEDFDFPAITPKTYTGKESQTESSPNYEGNPLGHIILKDYTQYHIQEVLNLRLVDVEAVRKANFRVVCDCINSIGGVVIPQLLKELGVEVMELNCQPTPCRLSFRT